ncbi:MAG: hypothetical protein ACFFAN_04590 [Promethearchaeota archaeon]
MINKNNLISKMGLSRDAVSNLFIKRREILEEYGSIIIILEGRYPTEYHLNDYFKRIIQVLQYFKNY